MITVIMCIPDSDDTDATAYEDLEGAVSAHPEKCLRFLATWGLQYSDLQRPGDFIQRKRKMETDDGSGSRRIRTREIFHDDMVESIISRDKSDEMVTQDRITRVGPRVPFTTEITWREVLEQYPVVSGHRRMPFDTGSASTDHQRIRDMNGRVTDSSGMYGRTRNYKQITGGLHHFAISPKLQPRLLPRGSHLR